MAARWTRRVEHTDLQAMKMYRNYDGNRSTFGETSIRRTNRIRQPCRHSPRSDRLTAL